MSQLRAVILQASALPGEVAVFLFEGGVLRGPQAFSTIGMRIQNEQSGSTSLFAQPMAIEPIPERTEIRDLESGIRDQGSAISANRAVEHEPRVEAALEVGILSPARLSRSMLETRLESVLASLAEPVAPPSSTQRQGHLALLKRWYYRPEVRRTGEIFFPDAEGHWPNKLILRGIGRVAAKSLQIVPSA